jgi:ankyrin repeat protein
VFARDDKGWIRISHSIETWASPRRKIPAGAWRSGQRSERKRRNLNITVSGVLCRKTRRRSFPYRKRCRYTSLDKNGWNPVHIASQNGHVDAVRSLIRAGVPVDLRNGAQKTPSALASGKGKVELGRLLIERGADLYAQDDQDWIPLHFAS